MIDYCSAPVLANKDGDMVRTCGKKVLGLNQLVHRGHFCVEFTCSPHACVGFFFL